MILLGVALLAVSLLWWWRQTLAQNKASDAILRLLTDGGWWYGLDLIKASGGKLKRGVIYSYLAQLEDDGLIASREESVTQRAIGIARRLYRITERGREKIAGASQ